MARKRESRLPAPNQLGAMKCPAVERAFAAVTQLSEVEQLELWMRLYAARAPITDHYRDQIDYLQDRIIRAESRPSREKRLLTELDVQILEDKITLSWAEMAAKHGLPVEALRQMHRRAQKCLRDHYVETRPGLYRPVGHGERVYPTWEAVLIQRERNKSKREKK